MAHVLALALVVTTALRLSWGWRGRLARRLGRLAAHPGYPAALVVTALLGAYGLECAFLAWHAGVVADLVAGGGLVSYGLGYWLLGYLRYAPYVLAAAAVLESGRRSGAVEGLRPGLDGDAVKAAEPVYRTIVPWAVAVALVLVFPRVSSFGPGSAGFLERLPAIGLFCGMQALSGLLTLPFFLGVVMPTAGRLLSPVAARLPEAFRPALTVLAGGLLAWAWAVLLPRPAPVAGVMGASWLTAAAGCVGYLAAAAVGASDRTIVWPALTLAVVWGAALLVPTLLGLVVQW